MNTNGKGVDVHTTVRIPRTQHERLRRIAQREHRTVSAEVRLLITRHIDTHEPVEPTEAAA